MDFLPAYERYGVAGLFIAMYIATIFMFIKYLIVYSEKEIKRCENLATLITKSTEVSQSQIILLEKLKDSVDHCQYKVRK